jgi:4-hydroxy-tetrahydrodipicolinate synthase
LYQAVLENDLSKARELFYRQLPLLDFILKGGCRRPSRLGCVPPGWNRAIRGYRFFR